MGLGIRSFGSDGFLPLPSLMILGKSTYLIAYIFTKSGLYIVFLISFSECLNDLQNKAIKGF